jgi:hypothetical protein
MRPDRLAKVRALLDSPVEGERQAAAAAMERLAGETPVRGSSEWNEAVRAFHAKIEFCSVHRTTPTLDAADQRTIRNFLRYGGSPFGRGTERLEAVYLKIRRHREQEGLQ